MSGPASQNDECPGLYIHIPFCIRKCHYCGFYSITDLSLIPDYLAALRREIALYRDWDASFDTIYIGGGTPSILPVGELEILIADVRRAFTITNDAEITIESNPGDITPALLAALKRAGVNRLNIGVQSFDDDSLKLLGRRHTAEQARDAFCMARNAGFENIGLDLIYGLPSKEVVTPAKAGVHNLPQKAVTPAEAGVQESSQKRVIPAKAGVQGANGDMMPHRVPICSPKEDRTFSTWLATLNHALDLNPDHLSCYQLTLEEGTSLSKRHRLGEIVLPDESEQADYFLRTSQILEENGYIHYEVSNFARPGRESRHNQKYWNHTRYLGLGPAAHSFAGRERRWNRRAVDAYLHDLAEGRPPVESKEYLSDEQLRLEALFLGFRTRRGIGLEKFRIRYGQDLLADKREMIDKLSKEGLVEIRNGYLRPTRSGMAVADCLAMI